MELDLDAPRDRFLVGLSLYLYTLESLPKPLEALRARVVALYATLPDSPASHAGQRTLDLAIGRIDKALAKERACSRMAERLRADGAVNAATRMERFAENPRADLRLWDARRVNAASPAWWTGKAEGLSAAQDLAAFAYFSKLRPLQELPE